MKKICGVIVMLFTIGLMWSQDSVLAQSDDEKLETTNFVKASGVITNVETKQGTTTLTVETTGEEPRVTLYNVTDETMVYNSGSTKKMEKEGFQKGQQIDVYYDKDKPMILIYPPQISPDLVIVQDTKLYGSVKVGKFDGELSSLDNELSLKVDHQTILENTEGQKIERQELNGKELVVFYTMATKSIPAQTVPTKIIALAPMEAETEDASNFVKFSGVITEITNDKNKIALTVVTEEAEPFTTIFTLDENMLFFNGTNAEAVKKESFQIGQKVVAYYDKNKPMILIYPARITPDIFIVTEEEEFSFVKVAKFDQEMISLDGELQLTISKDTEIQYDNGEAANQDELVGKELIVFYSFTKTGEDGITEQTTPSKVVAINYLTPELKRTIENDHFIQNGTKMIPLRQVAEQLGYEVKNSTAPNQKLITLTKGNSSFGIYRDTKAYSYNKSLQLFSEKPVLRDQKTYVSEEILDLLK